jgi:hypothetical protein
MVTGYIWKNEKGNGMWYYTEKMKWYVSAVVNGEDHGL